MANKVDFKLLLPDWMFESDRFVDFIEVLEEFADDVMSGIDEVALLRNLVVLLESGEWIEQFVRQLGAGFGFDSSELYKVAGDITECIRRVGTYDAFRYVVKQIYGGISIEDNFNKVLRLSENGVLSGAYLQDGVYYRDGAWGASLPYFLSTDRNLKIIKQWFPVGVFLYFFAIMFLFLLESRDSIDRAVVGYGLGIPQVGKEYLYITEEGIRDYYTFDKQYLNENWQWFRFVVNEDAIIIRFGFVMNDAIIMWFELIMNEDAIILS